MSKTWIISLRYLQPEEGTTYITANTEEEAVAKAKALFSARQELHIVDVIESPMSQLEMDLKSCMEEGPFVMTPIDDKETIN